MRVTTCDAKGRFYLRRSLRKHFGDRFVVVPLRDELILIPVPVDPIADLADLGASLGDHSIEELKAHIEAQAAAEVGA